MNMSLLIFALLVCFGTVEAKLRLKEPSPRSSSDKIRLKPCGGGVKDVPQKAKYVHWAPEDMVIAFEHDIPAGGPYGANASVQMNLLQYSIDPVNVNLTVLTKELELWTPILLNNTPGRQIHAANYTLPSAAKCRAASPGCVLMLEMTSDDEDEMNPWYSCADIRILSALDNLIVEFYIREDGNPMLPIHFLERIRRYSTEDPSIYGGLTEWNVRFADPDIKEFNVVNGVYFVAIIITDWYDVKTGWGYNAEDIADFILDERISDRLSTILSADVKSASVFTAPPPDADGSHSLSTNILTILATASSALFLAGL